MSTKGDSVVLTIKLRQEKKEVDTINKVTGSEDIMRIALGSATIGQLDGWREEKHPFCHDSTFFRDPGNEMITKVVRTKEKGQKTPAEDAMTTVLGVASWCIGELITIEDLDHTITETGPTAKREYSESSP